MTLRDNSYLYRLSGRSYFSKRSNAQVLVIIRRARVSTFVSKVSGIRILSLTRAIRARLVREGGPFARMAFE